MPLTKQQEAPISLAISMAAELAKKLSKGNAQRLRGAQELLRKARDASGPKAATDYLGRAVSALDGMARHLNAKNKQRAKKLADQIGKAIRSLQAAPAPKPPVDPKPPTQPKPQPPAPQPPVEPPVEEPPAEEEPPTLPPVEPQPRPPKEGYLRLWSPDAQVVRATPGTFGSLATKLRPGQVLELDDGEYPGGTLTLLGTPEEPVWVRARDPHRATFAKKLALKGRFAGVDGVAFRGREAQFEMHADGGRVSGCLFADTPHRGYGGAAVFDIYGEHVEIDHCELTRIGTFGLRMGPLGRLDPPLDARIHHNHFHRFASGGQNATEPLQLGRSNPHHGVAYGCVVEWNLFEDCQDSDPETLSLKSSGNIVRFNTLRRSRRLQNRGGERNQIIANTIIKGSHDSSIRICAGHHKVIGNFVDAPKGILVQGGTYEWSEGNKPIKGMARAHDVLLCGNRANRLTVGDDEFKGAKMPAIRTTIEKHMDLQGRVLRGWGGAIVRGPLEADTRWSDRDPGELPQARELSAGEVGPKARRR